MSVTSVSSSWARWFAPSSRSSCSWFLQRRERFLSSAALVALLEAVAQIQPYNWRLNSKGRGWVFKNVYSTGQKSAWAKKIVFWDGSFRFKSPGNACKCSSKPQTSLCFSFLDEIQFKKQSTTWPPSPSRSNSASPCTASQNKSTLHSFPLSVSLFLALYSGVLPVISVSNVALNC